MPAARDSLIEAAIAKWSGVVPEAQSQVALLVSVTGIPGYGCAGPKNGVLPPHWSQWTAVDSTNKTALKPWLGSASFMKGNPGVSILPNVPANCRSAREMLLLK